MGRREVWMTVGRKPAPVNECGENIWGGCSALRRKQSEKVRVSCGESQILKKMSDSKLNKAWSGCYRGKLSCYRCCTGSGLFPASLLVLTGQHTTVNPPRKTRACKQTISLVSHPPSPTGYWTHTNLPFTAIVWKQDSHIVYRRRQVHLLLQEISGNTVSHQLRTQSTYQSTTHRARRSHERQILPVGSSQTVGFSIFACGVCDFEADTLQVTFFFRIVIKTLLVPSNKQQRLKWGKFAVQLQFCQWGRWRGETKRAAMISAFYL